MSRRPMRLQERLRRAVASLGLLVGSLAVAFLVVEALARAFFATPIQPRFVMDSGFGIRDNQPRVATWHTSPGEYQVRITTNSAGMRGSRDYPESKPAGVRRIAVLGDSFAFGYGVTDHDVASAVLERELNRRSNGTRYEVLNFSVSGFGQAEELILYRNKVRRYAPDDVVLFYFSNDVGNNLVSNLFTVSADGRAHPTGSSYLPGVSVRQWMYDVPGVNWFLQRSYGWNLIRNRLSALAHRILLSKSNLVSYTDSTPEGVELTRALLKQLMHDVAQDGARPIVFAIPDSDIATNFPFSQAAREELRLLFIDGSSVASSDDYYPLDGHWKASGHRKAALALVSVLEEPR